MNDETSCTALLNANFPYTAITEDEMNDDPTIEGGMICDNPEPIYENCPFCKSNLCYFNRRLKCQNESCIDLWFSTPVLEISELCSDIMTKNYTHK